MDNDELLTDEYVADLLAKDAKASAIRYSALGLDGLTHSRSVEFEQRRGKLTETGPLQINRNQTLGFYETS